MNGTAATFGSYAVHWKSDVREVLTYTPSSGTPAKGVPARRANNMFWLIAKANADRVKQVVAEATGYELGGDLATTIDTGIPALKWTSFLIEAQIHRRRWWNNVAHLIISWSGTPGEGELGFDAVVRRRQEILEFQRQNGFEFPVEMHENGGRH